MGFIEKLFRFNVDNLLEAGLSRNSFGYRTRACSNASSWRHPYRTTVPGNVFMSAIMIDLYQFVKSDEHSLLKVPNGCVRGGFIRTVRVGIHIDINQSTGIQVSVIRDQESTPMGLIPGLRHFREGGNPVRFLPSEGRPIKEMRRAGG
jgi:hypothetical protein